MKKILLVKTSSMGDVIHNLPVASDIGSMIGDAEIHWLVEESLAAIPKMHPEVKRVITVAMRRWRTTLWQPRTRREIRAFMHELREQVYDAVIDTQGLLKSAVLAWMAKGMRCGLDWASAREPLALFYDRTYSIPWTMHAVERNRMLAAQALNYALPATIDYGIRASKQEFAWLPPVRYAVLLHATSADRKLWDEANWLDVGRYLSERGISSVLPWGNTDERDRSEKLAARITGAIVPPALEVDAAGALLTGAYAVVGVDTGLTHFAAALGTPTVGVYRATDPGATGLYGSRRAVNVGSVGKPPKSRDVIAAVERLTA